MAEETCEITEQIEQEEEEEEVSPELQTSRIPGMNITAAPSVEEITDPGVQLQDGMKLLEKSAELLGYSGEMRASAAFNIAKKVNEDIRPGLPGTDILLEDDITLTPVVTNLFSAEKSTWVFENGSITGEAVSYTHLTLPTRS